MRILAIETSCDETSIAIVEFSGTKRNPAVRVFSHIVLSQIKTHQEFGGVVPNLAKREHQCNLPLILKQALGESGGEVRIMNQESRINAPEKIYDSKFVILDSLLEREPGLLNWFKKEGYKIASPDIDAIAVTYGPGLEPALWVGINFAKALAMLWEKPLIPVNHMEGHLYSALLLSRTVILAEAEIQVRSAVRVRKPGFRISPSLKASEEHGTSGMTTQEKYQIRKIQFPAIALLVSGAHTELILMTGHGKYQKLGQTLDDAGGEAFDKVARMLGLPYPGGPEISKLAESVPHFIKGELGGISLPRPMLKTKDYNFSFSGLKTAVLYTIRDLEKKYSIEELRAPIAKEFQDAVVEVLVTKTLRAMKEYDAKTLLVGGGVSANKQLREKLRKETERLNIIYYIPDVSLTGDNALMIAIAAFFNGKKKTWNRLEQINAEGNLSIEPLLNRAQIV